MAYTVRHNADLTAAHTFRLQGSACKCLVEYDNALDLPLIFADTTLPRPFLPIGGGSNMFFNGTFPGTVIHCTDCTIRIDGAIVHVGAAAVLDDVCRLTACHHLWGVESLSGIPGQISGAIVQNAGAYGAEISDIIESVTVYDIPDNSIRVMSNAECRFGYRTSRFKDNEVTRPDFIITGATLRLSENAPLCQAHRAVDVSPSSTPQSVRDAVLQLRDSKLPDPAIIGSAGSFFKNPVIDLDTLHRILHTEQIDSVPTYPVDEIHVKLPAAWLIDRCGLKGATEGGAAVWHRQPLVLVNATGQATSTDVNALAQRIINQVYQRYGIILEREVIYVH